MVGFNHYCAHINASVISSFKELLKVSITLPPVLNALSEATVDTGIARMSLAIIDKTGYMTALSFH
jgi:hypothetical protein